MLMICPVLNFVMASVLERKFNIKLWCCKVKLKSQFHFLAKSASLDEDFSSASQVCFILTLVLC